MIFTMTYFGKTNETIYNVLENEILRVWRDAVLLNFNELAERLAYIPIDRIKYALGQNCDFIWNNTGEYTHISRFIISEEERDEVRCFVEKEIRKHRYISITDITLSNISEHNYNLSITAIHNAIYRICLADNYDKYGKIITYKGDKINALNIMEECCRSLDRITLDNLLELERDLTGECHRWIPMNVGYSVMVRIDENNFIAEKYLEFDIIAVDNAIEQFMNGADYLPLKAITTFVMFPYCGQDWNLFLLESYVMRFSERYRFKVGALNNKNVGVIVRKSSNLIKNTHTRPEKGYDLILIDAVAKANVALDVKNILSYLFNEGYIAKMFKSNITEIINLAKMQRQRGG